MVAVEIPCFIGDTIYFIGKRKKHVHASTVRRILITRGGVWLILRCGKKGRIGKDLFFSEEDAEASMDSVMDKGDGE